MHRTPLTLTRLLFAGATTLVLGFACNDETYTVDDGNDASTSMGGTNSKTTSTTSTEGMTMSATSSGPATGGGSAGAPTISDSTSGSNGVGGSAGASTTGDAGAAGSGSDELNCEPPTGDIPELGLETVASGLAQPVFVTQAPADSERLFVVEQGGTIATVRSGSTEATPFLDMETQVSRTNTERGLLAVAFHPNYQKNGRFYVHYSASEGTHALPDGASVLSEFTVSDDPDVADPDSERVLFTLNQPFANHNGGMIAFGPDDGYLYLALGDGGSGGDPNGNGQNQNALFGKVLRLDVDGRDAGEYGIPPGNMPGGAPEIWDMGLRNPWRFSFDPCTADMYIGDVGQNDYEEINVEPAGTGSKNYGWNVREGQSCYNSNTCDFGGMTEPVLAYGRADGGCVIGGYVYRGSGIPALRGTYIYGDYQTNRVWAFEYAEGTITDHRALAFDRALDGLASFGQDNSGELYLVLRGSGEIVKLVPR